MNLIEVYKTAEGDIAMDLNVLELKNLSEQDRHNLLAKLTKVPNALALLGGLASDGVNLV